MTIHGEIHLEDEICADLAAAGWLFDPADASRYDRAQALYLDDVVAWIAVQAIELVLPEPAECCTWYLWPGPSAMTATTSFRVTLSW